MGWEKRGGQRYYYKARRIGGRVVKSYLGRGHAAKRLALQEKAQHEDRQQEMRRRRAEREDDRDFEAALMAYLDTALALARALIEAEGFHRPGRGQWRRKRITRRNAMNELARTQDSQRALEALPTDIKARRALVNRACNKRATQQDFQRAARILREEPDIVDGFETVSAFMDSGISFVIERSIGNHADDRIDREVLLADAHMEVELLAGGTWASPALRLLASRVVAAKYHLAAVERDYKSAVAGWNASMRRYRERKQKWEQEWGQPYMSENPPTLDREAQEKRLERAHRMHLSALKVLIDAQRLPLPPVQIATTGGVSVNVGESVGLGDGARAGLVIRP